MAYEVPTLVETRGGTNLVDYAGKIYAVPQSLGPLDLRDPAQRSRPGIVAHASVEVARAATPALVHAPARPSAGPVIPRRSLRELEANFLRFDDKTHFHWVDTIGEASGIEFLCPLCFERNGGPAGTHAVICWSRSRGVPDDAHPGPGRWRLVGTSIDDLSLMEEPGQTRSVALLGGCAWHGFVTDGMAG